MIVKDVMHNFELFQPKQLKDAFALLDRYGKDSWKIAGGNDSLTDTPTNYGTDTGAGGEVRGNFCTWNPLVPGATLTNGNLDADPAYAAGGMAFATFGMNTGKWRFLKSSWMSTLSAISWLRRTASSCPGKSRYISSGGRT